MVRTIMKADAIRERYFDWLCGIIDGPGNHEKLIWKMFNTDFNYMLEMDGNRYEDGVDLRYRYGIEIGMSDNDIAAYLDCRQCSIFEMMVALSMRCEEIIADDEAGNQADEIFWEMIVSLGLYKMSDISYHEEYVDAALYDFVNRLYSRNGRGGLFTLRHSNEDLRKVEIWVQAMWYLDEKYEKMKGELL